MTKVKGRTPKKQVAEPKAWGIVKLNHFGHFLVLMRLTKGQPKVGTKLLSGNVVALFITMLCKPCSTSGCWGGDQLG